MSRFKGLSLGGLVLVVAQACLTREVSVEEPTTKISFQTSVPQPGVDKVDLLVVVDNSSSMGDKQQILADALPDLLKGLVQPKCVDEISRAPTGVVSDPAKPIGKQCPAGQEPAFTPITDMHIGVISTSLGGFGVTSRAHDGPPVATCGDVAGENNDDGGRLLARGANGSVAAAGDLHFLAWYPDVETNRDKDRHPDPPVPKTETLADLGAAFKDLVVGVGQNGCGIEAQLESAYRFLIQPDPSEISVVDGKPVVHGVDRELLRQRAAFLRPDSLVAVVMLTDEEDVSLDPMSFSGSGWRFLERTPLPRATAACETAPASKACTSCRFAPQDPSCAANGGLETTAEANLNIRFHRMRQRYGADPRYPIARYVDGLSKYKVPRRVDEHADGGAYVGTPACTNPLFAAKLPTGADGEELCVLPRGPRTKDFVYLAVIGGVPGTLLPNANDPSADVDWTRILGRDPLAYDTTGIDPHMIESTTPRPGLPGTDADYRADPVHGREWNTGGGDLQLACAFDLYERRASGEIVPVRRTCDASTGLCDCTTGSNSPLCDPKDTSVQVRGKAYPSLRELTVARELGANGIPASLCPAQLTQPEQDDYGYRPAMRRIVDRIERGLVACLPRALVRSEGETGSVSCLVVATLPDDGPDSDCAKFGLAPPRADLLGTLRAAAVESEGPEAGRKPMCELPQVVVPAQKTCKYDDDAIGFCYAEGVPGIRCPHSLQFTKPTEKMVGARFSLQCIQVSH